MLQISQLSYTYPEADSPAVRDVSFAVGEGEIFGFLGPSGAGKSTTQKIIIGLLKGYSGSVQILGRNLADWGSDLYEQVGVSFELPNHYLKLSGRENLEFFRSLYEGPTRRPEDLLELVGLEDDADTRLSAYSKGMMMRLNFIRALLHDPLCLFLDEPTSGLDPVNARTIREIILGLKAEGKTIFLTTHDMHVADELCDRVAFIVDGEIVLIDSPRTLKLENGAPLVRVEYRENGSGATIDFPLDGLGTNPAFLTLIQSAQIETIHSLEATLEDVFIRTTGRSLA